MSSQTYVNAAVKNIEERLKKGDLPVLKLSKGLTPMSDKYRPEVDMSEELNGANDLLPRTNRYPTVGRRDRTCGCTIGSIYDVVAARQSSHRSPQRSPQYLQLPEMSAEENAVLQPCLSHRR